MAQQKALFLPTNRAEFVVGTTEIPKPQAGELLIKIHSAALNPVDWKIPHYDLPYVSSYPAIVGTDIAGTVEAVGEGVIGFEKGDRIVTQGFFNNRNTAFQQFTIQPAEIAAKIPSNVTFDEAASLPAGIATAALALYGTAGLTPPWAGGLKAYEGQPIVVFGGSGAVGQSVIQFAKLSGFSPIITTASLHNTDFLKTLGATHVIDRKADVAEEIRKITSEPISLVYDAISSPETQAVALEVTAEGGSLMLVLEPQVDKDKYPSKKLLSVLGSVHPPHNRALGIALYGVLEEYLEKEPIKPNRVEMLPDGLQGIIGGLKKMEENLVSGVKLVARPQETA